MGRDPELQSSDIPSSEKKRISKLNGNLTASEIENFNAKLGGNFVRNVSRTFANGAAIEIADTMISKAAREKLFSQDCVSAIKNRLEAGQQITLVKSGISGDYSYEIEFSGELSADLQVNLTEQLKPELGLGLSRQGTSKLRGSKLYWGIRDDRVALRPLVNAMDPTIQYAVGDAAAASIAGNARLIPAETAFLESKR